jgi:hypothetical protein
VRAALTPIILTAAGLLVVAALAKLRAPAPAARALATVGVPIPAGAVRLLCLGELGLGLLGLLATSRVSAAALAGAYAGFAGLALALARRRSACGCFGDPDVPASGSQALLSLTLAAACVVGIAVPAHDLGWVLGQSPSVAMTLVLGVGGSIYAAVLAYTALPVAWATWSGR